MGKSKFSIEFKKEVCEYTNDHTYAQAQAKFGVTNKSMQAWRKALGYPPMGRGFRRSSPTELNFKHEVCQYYDNHTWEETVTKFDCAVSSLLRWRRELGYRNKSRGYNLYTQEYRQEARKPLHFKSGLLNRFTTLASNSVLISSRLPLLTFFASERSVF